MLPFASWLRGLGSKKPARKHRHSDSTSSNHFLKMSRQVIMEMICLGQRTLCRIHFSVPAVQDAPKKKTKKPMKLCCKEWQAIRGNESWKSKVWVTCEYLWMSGWFLKIFLLSRNEETLQKVMLSLRLAPRSDKIHQLRGHGDVGSGESFNVKGRSRNMKRNRNVIFCIVSRRAKRGYAFKWIYEKQCRTTLFPSLQFSRCWALKFPVSKAVRAHFDQICAMLALIWWSPWGR